MATKKNYKKKGLPIDSRTLVRIPSATRMKPNAHTHKCPHALSSHIKTKLTLHNCLIHARAVVMARR